MPETRIIKGPAISEASCPDLSRYDAAKKAGFKQVFSISQRHRRQAPANLIAKMGSDEISNCGLLKGDLESSQQTGVSTISR